MLEYGDAVLRELTLLSMAGELGEDVAPIYTTPEVDLSAILAAVETAVMNRCECWIWTAGPVSRGVPRWVPRGSRRGQPGWWPCSQSLPGFDQPRFD